MLWREILPLNASNTNAGVADAIYKEYWDLNENSKGP